MQKENVQLETDINVQLKFLKEDTKFEIEKEAKGKKESQRLRREGKRKYIGEIGE